MYKLSHFSDSNYNENGRVLNTKLFKMSQTGSMVLRVLFSD